MNPLVQHLLLKYTIYNLAIKFTILECIKTSSSNSNKCLETFWPRSNAETPARKSCAGISACQIFSFSLTQIENKFQTRRPLSSEIFSPQNVLQLHKVEAQEYLIYYKNANKFEQKNLDSFYPFLMETDNLVFLRQLATFHFFGTMRLKE